VDRTVRLWDADTGRLFKTLTGATATVARVAFAPHGTEVAGLCLDGTVRRWASNSGAALPTLQLEAMGLKAAGNGNVDYSPDGRHLAASATGVLSVWTLPGP
jgi:WD40 repeat protein